MQTKAACKICSVLAASASPYYRASRLRADPNALVVHANIASAFDDSPQDGIYA